MSQATVAAAILRANTFCVLGTASLAGDPWITPVAYKIDDQCNFYWTSVIQTKHSTLLAKNPRMSLCVIDQKQVADITYPNGKSQPRAVYVSGQGREIPYDELGALLHLRYGHGQKKVEDFDPTAKQARVYQLVTTDLWCLNDKQPTGNTPTDDRVAIDLAELRQLLSAD